MYTDIHGQSQALKIKVYKIVDVKWICLSVSPCVGQLYHLGKISYSNVVSAIDGMFLQIRITLESSFKAFLSVHYDSRCCF